MNLEPGVLTAGGDSLVAAVTRSSAALLGPAPGQPAMAFVKAPWVMLFSSAGDAGPQIRVSARIQLARVVKHVDVGAVNCTIGLRLPGGSRVHAVLTLEAVHEFGLKTGVPATALIKAGHVILGVPA